MEKEVCRPGGQLWRHKTWDAKWRLGEVNMYVISTIAPYFSVTYILINLGGRKYVKIPAVTAGHLKTYFPLHPLTLMHGGAFVES
jgi:hypothetical protein